MWVWNLNICEDLTEPAEDSQSGERVLLFLEKISSYSQKLFPAMSQENHNEVKFFEAAVRSEGTMSHAGHMETAIIPIFIRDLKKYLSGFLGFSLSFCLNFRVDLVLLPSFPPLHLAMTFKIVHETIGV